MCLASISEAVPDYIVYLGIAGVVTPYHLSIMYIIISMFLMMTGSGACWTKTEFHVIFWPSFGYLNEDRV